MSYLYDDRILRTGVRLARHCTQCAACHVHVPLSVHRDAEARIMLRRAELPGPKLLTSGVILAKEGVANDFSACSQACNVDIPNPVRDLSLPLICVRKRIR